MYTEYGTPSCVSGGYPGGGVLLGSPNIKTGVGATKRCGGTFGGTYNY